MRGAEGRVTGAAPLRPSDREYFGDGAGAVGRGGVAGAGGGAAVRGGGEGGRRVRGVFSEPTLHTSLTAGAAGSAWSADAGGCGRERGGGVAGCGAAAASAAAGATGGATVRHAATAALGAERGALAVSVASGASETGDAPHERVGAAEAGHGHRHRRREGGGGGVGGVIYEDPIVHTIPLHRCTQSCTHTSPLHLRLYAVFARAGQSGAQRRRGGTLVGRRRHSSAVEQSAAVR
eukprot:ctg_372.g236